MSDSTNSITLLNNDLNSSVVYTDTATLSKLEESYIGVLPREHPLDPTIFGDRVIGLSENGIFFSDIQDVLETTTIDTIGRSKNPTTGDVIGSSSNTGNIFYRIDGAGLINDKSDYFDDVAVDPTLWTTSTFGGATITESGGLLRVNFAGGGTSGGTLYSNYILAGNCTIRSSVYNTIGGLGGTSTIGIIIREDTDNYIQFTLTSVQSGADISSSFNVTIVRDGTTIVDEDTDHTTNSAFLEITIYNDTKIRFRDAQTDTTIYEYDSFGPEAYTIELTSSSDYALGHFSYFVNYLLLPAVTLSKNVCDITTSASTSLLVRIPSSYTGDLDFVLSFPTEYGEYNTFDYKMNIVQNFDVFQGDNFIFMYDNLVNSVSSYTSELGRTISVADPLVSSGNLIANSLDSTVSNSNTTYNVVVNKFGYTDTSSDVYPSYLISDDSKTNYEGISRDFSDIRTLMTNEYINFWFSKPESTMRSTFVNDDVIVFVYFNKTNNLGRIWSVRYNLRTNTRIGNPYIITYIVPFTSYNDPTPCVVKGSNGILYCIYQDYSTTNSFALHIYRSIDDGATWSFFKTTDSILSDNTPHSNAELGWIDAAIRSDDLICLVFEYGVTTPSYSVTGSYSVMTTGFFDNVWSIGDESERNVVGVDTSAPVYTAAAAGLSPPETVVPFKPCVSVSNDDSFLCSFMASNRVIGISKSTYGLSWLNVAAPTSLAYILYAQVVEDIDGRLNMVGEWGIFNFPFFSSGGYGSERYEFSYPYDRLLCLDENAVHVWRYPYLSKGNKNKTILTGITDEGVFIAKKDSWSNIDSDYVNEAMYHPFAGLPSDVGWVPNTAPSNFASITDDGQWLKLDQDNGYNNFRRTVPNSSFGNYLDISEGFSCKFSLRGNDSEGTSTHVDARNFIRFVLKGSDNLGVISRLVDFRIGIGGDNVILTDGFNTLAEASSDVGFSTETEYYVSIKGELNTIRLMVYRTRDELEVWEQIFNYNLSYTIDPTSPNYIYIGSDRNLYDTYWRKVLWKYKDDDYMDPTDSTKTCVAPFKEMDGRRIVRYTKHEFPNGIRLKWTGLDGFENDEWSVSAQAEFSSTNILNDSPTSYWRSSDAITQQIISFDSYLDSLITYDSNLACFMGCNFRYCVLEASNIDDFDTAAEYSREIDFEIDGGFIDQIEADAITDLDKEYNYNELLGKYISFYGSNRSDSEGYNAGLYSFKITRNSKNKIYVDFGNLEFSSLLSTTIAVDDEYVIYDNKTSFILSSTSSLKYRYWRIRIPTTSYAGQTIPSEKYFQIGKFDIGDAKEIPKTDSIGYPIGYIMSNNLETLFFRNGRRVDVGVGDNNSVISFHLPALSENLVKYFTSMFEYVRGAEKPVWILPNQSVFPKLIYLTKIISPLELQKLLLEYQDVDIDFEEIK